MDKNNHIQQLINSRKLSTNEEYELFEGALQALHMSISIARRGIFKDDCNMHTRYEGCS